MGKFRARRIAMSRSHERSIWVDFAPVFQGLRRVNVTLLNTATGETRSAVTNTFGYYNFNDIPSGAAYVVTVSSRRYTFSNPSQVVNVSDNVSELNFIANE